MYKFSGYSIASDEPHPLRGIAPLEVHADLSNIEDGYDGFAHVAVGSLTVAQLLAVEGFEEETSEGVTTVAVPVNIHEELTWSREG